MQVTQEQLENKNRARREQSVHSQREQLLALAGATFTLLVMFHQIRMKAM